jgi:hypothetical protein
MTYRAGVVMWGDGGFSSVPTLTCDMCKTVMDVRAVRGAQPLWLINKKAPKGWRRYDRGDSPAQHACPKCKGQWA